ncbi:hypothetical protein K7711_42320 [Nocardia sp. CA2R105]|uniref:hypothetical protein n=1 Tax=Nocardia coffeae TaxID=2873381 RepID=UPI001CA7B4D8|nr:hypothetical protein [Nocardia coffeae]MBY8863165.1 hypothetical protein [Nocardia coffeae]
MARFEVNTEGTTTDAESTVIDTEESSTDTEPDKDPIGKISDDIKNIADQLAEIQSKEGNRKWTDGISRWAAYLAFVVFFIGASTFPDLKEDFTHQKQVDQNRHTYDLEVYFNSVSRTCPELPPPITAQQLRAESEEQETAAGKWDDLNGDSKTLTESEKNDMKTAVEYLFNAEQDLFAMASDLDRDDIASYNIQLGEYLQSITSMRSLTRPHSPISVLGPYCTAFSPNMH